MTYEELEKLKKDHDYCIIPTKNIIGIDEDMPIQDYGIMIIKIKLNNSIYFIKIN